MAPENQNTIESSDEMNIPPGRAAELASNLARTLNSLKSAAQQQTTPRHTVRLVAVSKLKPASDILALCSPANESIHTSGSLPASAASEILPHLHFGENYTQELLRKADLLPRSIRWHFIGALQSNKCKALAERIPNLWAVESVDDAKKADLLEKGRKALIEARQGADGGGGNEDDGGVVARTRIYVQVNTSGEDSKSGVEPEKTSALAKHIVENCPNLQLQGLMTIGAIARSQAASAGEGELNEDFTTLKKVRTQVAKNLGWEESKLELSMGMSADYEDAIRQGSDEIRIGTGIFGSRPPKNVTKDEKHNEEDDKEGNK